MITFVAPDLFCWPARHVEGTEGLGAGAGGGARVKGGRGYVACYLTQAQRV